MTNDNECLWCNAPIEQSGTGRRKRYCSRSHRQRAYESRKYGIPTVYDLMKRHISHCYLCGLLLDWEDMQSIVFDHEIATVHGGTTNVTNLRPVHRLCNLSKANRLI